LFNLYFYYRLSKRDLLVTRAVKLIVFYNITVTVTVHVRVGGEGARSEEHAAPTTDIGHQRVPGITRPSCYSIIFRS
jgi:hypothetical protein